MEALMDRNVVAEITSHYQALTSLVPLRAIRNEQDYDTAISALNRLLDVGAAGDEHPLADLVNVLGNFISDYENQQYPAKPVTPVAMIRFLMEQHGLSQSPAFRQSPKNLAGNGKPSALWALKNP